MNSGDEIFCIQARFIRADGDSCTKDVSCAATDNSKFTKFHTLKLNTAQNSNNTSPYPSLAFSYDEIGIVSANVVSNNAVEVKVFMKNKASGMLGQAVHNVTVRQNAGPMDSHFRLRLYREKLFNGSIDIIIHMNEVAIQSDYLNYPIFPPPSQIPRC